MQDRAQRGARGEDRHVFVAAGIVEELVEASLSSWDRCWTRLQFRRHTFFFGQLVDVLLSAEEAAAAPLVLKGGAHVRSPDDEPHGEPAAEILSMLDSVVARNNISPCHRPVRHKSDQRYSFSYFGVTLVTRGVLYSWSPCCRRSQSLVVQSLPQIGDSRELQIIL